MNYSQIKDSYELPNQVATIVGLSVNSEQDARQYAVEHPDRQIYWLTESHIAVWFIPKEAQVPA